MGKDDLKLLLLQIRNRDDVRQEEHHSFAMFTGLKQAQIEILNVFDTPAFSPGIVDGYDALLVGGASEASVLEPEAYAFIRPSEELIRYCVMKSIPVFASCYGFQLATIALGGEIIRDTVDYEIGTIPIYLTDLAKTDPIFKGVPNPFIAVSVHQERALLAPAGCETLAFTDKCCHSFKVVNKPFWAFQFHPEVNYPILVKRLTIFSEHYTENPAHLKQVLAAAVDTPDSNQLMRHFVDRVLLGQDGK